MISLSYIVESWNIFGPAKILRACIRCHFLGSDIFRQPTMKFDNSSAALLVEERISVVIIVYQFASPMMAEKNSMYKRMLSLSRVGIWISIYSQNQLVTKHEFQRLAARILIELDSDIIREDEWLTQYVKNRYITNYTKCARHAIDNYREFWWTNDRRT